MGDKFIAKIIHVISGLNVGGAELMLKRLVIESGKSSSLQQSIISLTKGGKVADELISQGFDVIHLDMRSVFSVPKAIYKLVKIFRNNRPNAVYTWMYHADLIGGLAAFFCRIKNIVWGIRCSKISQESFSVTSVIIKICSILSFHIPTKIVCCAEAARLTHIELGYCSDKMVVIPNGYDLTSFNPGADLRNRIRRDLGLSESTLVVGVVGRFDPLKDFNNFVQAASLVATNLDNVKFLMVGKGLDKNNTELNGWIVETQHQDNFILIGETNPHDLFAVMDLFCLSSKAEGFPNVVAEAMAMRIPCVVTDVGDAAKIVGISGKVVEPMNAHALHKGLMSMLTVERYERELLGDVARQLIENQYDIRVVQKVFLNLVSES